MRRATLVAFYLNILFEPLKTKMNVPRDVLDDSMKSELYGIDISFTILGALAVGLRFWARHRSAGNYGWDDWLVLVSMFILFINFALNAVSKCTPGSKNYIPTNCLPVIENGLGLQATDVPLSSLIMIGKAIYGDEIVYVVALAIIKVAILVMYCRVFPLRSFRIASWTLGTLTVIWSIMFIFICEHLSEIFVKEEANIRRHISMLAHP